jgi:hypothetical protein
MASWGDASWELHLSPLKSVGLALNIGVLVKEAKRLQKAEDMLGRRRKPAGEPVFKPTPKFPGKR